MRILVAAIVYDLTGENYLSEFVLKLERGIAFFVFRAGDIELAGFVVIYINQLQDCIVCRFFDPVAFTVQSIYIYYIGQVSGTYGFACSCILPVCAGTILFNYPVQGEDSYSGIE